MGPGNSEEALADCQKPAPRVKISRFHCVLCLPFGTIPVRWGSLSRHCGVFTTSEDITYLTT
jgi:hypothetical protein